MKILNRELSGKTFSVTAQTKGLDECILMVSFMQFVFNLDINTVQFFFSIQGQFNKESYKCTFLCNCRVRMQRLDLKVNSINTNESRCWRLVKDCSFFPGDQFLTSAVLLH